jgi:UDP-N-acetylglucosamine diphosphorylase / glucose-1-phosphate thymidylyltransferase / UDP-N-acetylgalactosamine diphosphorylase / glucosamine-1-phosphate N-acetyltransferase / galactosamine-1-phosphate N-acetyltransferase
VAAEEERELSRAGLYLYDDAVARSWQPFALTRPVGELLLGAHTFRARAELLLGMRCGGHISSAHLHGFEEPDAAGVVDAGAIGTDVARLFLNSRALLDWQDVPLSAGRSLLRAGGAIVGCTVPAGEPNPVADWFADPTAAPTAGYADVVLSGRLLEHVWDLVAANPAQIGRDIEAAERRGAVGDVPPAPGVHVIGGSAGDVRLAGDVTIEPNVVLDVSAGPIWLDAGVTVRAFTRLAGPAYVGPGSTLLGGPFAAVSIGPVCKVHGEIEETVVLGYSNKAHDGFLGHAYLGRWVNLGAMTTNSDLKNNYGRIRMWTPAGEADTGLMKLGCLLGDHVKTGIGALLNTGTVIGAGSNLFGTAMPPKYVPPFSWGSGSELDAFDPERFLALADTVMGRRSLDLTDGMRGMLRAAWQLGRSGA